MKPTNIIFVVMIFAFSTPAMSGEVEVIPSSPTGAQGEFAAEEIRREAKLAAESLRIDPYTTRVVLLIQKDGTGVEQNYTIRVGYSQTHRQITVTGGTEIGAMYGGLDIAEAIRIGTLAALRDSDHAPHIA
jgi:hypothetical protein